MGNIVVCGSFDNIQSRQVLFLEEAARFGPLHVFLWADEVVKEMTGVGPKFPVVERRYVLEAVRFIHKVWTVNTLSSLDELPRVEGFKPGMWVVSEQDDDHQKRRYCSSNEIVYTLIKDADLNSFPILPIDDVQTTPNKKVLVTGCYDWFHSGHVRFFEETSKLGDLYVVVGHDENIRLLKGEGHPMFPEDERRCIVGSIRFVRQAMISSGSGWMDAEPEINLIQPDIYAVNDDGDKPDKRAFCDKHGLDYVVLKRKPAAGLPRRESTQLRGF